MKKITLLLVGMLLVMTSCNDDFTNEPTNTITTKYVDTITHANGSTISLDYDEEMRVSRVTYVDALDSSLNRQYDIKYNINTTNHTVTFDVITGNNKYLMEFNEYGALKSYSLNGEIPQVLSKFSYYTSHSIIGVFRHELIGIVDKVSGGEIKRIDWQSSVPAMVLSQLTVEEEGVMCEYSSTVRYGYASYRSNIHANVNLFALVSPEFFKYSNIPTELAACVSVFGSRSYYLPTDITIVEGRMPVGGNYEQLSETDYDYSYDTDSEGYILKIYTGKDDNNTKALLYTITYRQTTTTQE